MILACLQETRNRPTHGISYPCYTCWSGHLRNDWCERTIRYESLSSRQYAANGALDKRRLNENRLNTAIPFNSTFVTYSSRAATNSLVSDKGSSDKSRKATHLLVRTMVCVSALTQIENATVSKIAEKGSRRSISKKGWVWKITWRS